MNELTVANFNGVETIDSRLIAETIGKEHHKLLRDIRTYCDYLNESKIGLVDFFIASTYTDGKGEIRPCYLCTRKGCEMIANKLTGQKGITFTAMYINAFHDMKKTLTSKKTDKTEIEMMKVRIRMSNQYLKLAKVNTLSEQYKNILIAKSAEILSGEQLLPLPKSQQETYSATDIAKMLNVSAQKIGRIANENNLKTTEYGEWYRDKSKHSNKEVDTFRYNKKAIETLKKLL